MVLGVVSFAARPPQTGKTRSILCNLLSCRLFHLFSNCLRVNLFSVLSHSSFHPILCVLTHLIPRATRYLLDQLRPGYR